MIINMHFEDLFLVVLILYNYYPDEILTL